MTLSFLQVTVDEYHQPVSRLTATRALPERRKSFGTRQTEPFEE